MGPPGPALGQTELKLQWSELSPSQRAYLLTVYAIGAAVALMCFSAGGANDFSLDWSVLTIASLFVATVNVRLPRSKSEIISMGDVFTILALLTFGPGPALVTYWLQVVTSHTTNQIRKFGWQFLKETYAHKWLFNIAQCALSIAAMYFARSYVLGLGLPEPQSEVVGLAAIATAWFVTNTIPLATVIALLEKASIWTTWKDGLELYVLNFYGSAAAAGLLSFYYERQPLILLLALPIIAVFYQLYEFYIDKYEHARAHISELNKLYLQTVEALATAVDAKDRYTHGHIRRVQTYASELAKRMGITDENELMAIKSGALLHDIGKIAIPEYILNKPTVLTESEFEKMKIHPSIGASMLKGIEFPFPVEPLVKSHHERWDGKGYPDGLKGDEIPLSARILSLVDCYDAVTTNRPYRAPMAREQVVEFFRRESGRAYDPGVVEAFVQNVEALEEEGSKVAVPDTDIWGGEPKPTENVRPLEKVQPTVTYSKAMDVGEEAQAELYSVFEFIRTARSLQARDILAFIGFKLEALIPFDAAVFYLANVDEDVVQPMHVVGSMAHLIRKDISLPLDQKLSGWVAANNQALSNLPPFPDFRTLSDPKPQFEMSSIVPMNHRGTIIGSLALYRSEKTKFTDQEFRHLEIIAGQTAIGLHRSRKPREAGAMLFDEVTGLPNGYQMYLMFDQVAMDAQRYDYPLALLAFRIEDLSDIRTQYGHLSAAEIVRFLSRRLKAEVRDTDILVSYSEDQFLALHPKMTRDQAEALKSRIQNELDQQKFVVRHGVEISPRIAIGIAEFPQEGTKFEDLHSIAEWRLTDDQRIRSLANRKVAFKP